MENLIFFFCKSDYFMSSIVRTFTVTNFLLYMPLSVFDFYYVMICLDISQFSIIFVKLW